MLQTIDSANLHALTFPDFIVRRFDLNERAHRITVEMEGAWLDVDGGRALGPGLLLVENWSDVRVSQYADDAWVNVAHIEGESLKDLCEVEFGATPSLRGFSARTGLWTRFDVFGGTARYELLDASAP